MYTRQIAEIKVDGKPLGRHVNHDPRSLRYPFKASGVALTSHRWSADTDPILDQKQLGSCTGNAMTGALICSLGLLHQDLSADQQGKLNETLAVSLYSAATSLDSFPGNYPPTDTGSDGLDVAKAATQQGYINGYTHALSQQDALAALTIGPIIVGQDWYEGFDDPDSKGLISISGKIRGGHETCFDEIDVENKLVWFRQSWGLPWAIQGRACMTWDTFGQLLAKDGDATILTPLAQPAPTPTPTPDGDPDQTLVAATNTWSEHEKHNPDNEAAREALLAWRAAKGL